MLFSETISELGKDLVVLLQVMSLVVVEASVTPPLLFPEMEREVVIREVYVPPREAQEIGSKYGSHGNGTDAHGAENIAAIRLSIEEEAVPTRMSLSEIRIHQRKILDIRRFSWKRPPVDRSCVDPSLDEST